MPSSCINMRHCLFHLREALSPSSSSCKNWPCFSLGNEHCDKFAIPIFHLQEHLAKNFIFSSSRSLVVRKFRHKFHVHVRHITSFHRDVTVDQKITLARGKSNSLSKICGHSCWSERESIFTFSKSIMNIFTHSWSLWS